MIAKSKDNSSNKISKKDIVYLSDIETANISGGGVLKYFLAPYRKAFYAITGNDKHVSTWFYDDNRAYNAGILASIVTQIGIGSIAGSVGTVIVSKIYNSVKSKKS